jgi:hypothetical protein
MVFTKAQFVSVTISLLCGEYLFYEHEYSAREQETSPRFQR